MVNETIDKYKFKVTLATAILVIIFIIVTSIQTATWKANMEAECNSNLVQIDMMKGQQVIDKEQDITDYETDLNLAIEAFDSATETLANAKRAAGIPLVGEAPPDETVFPTAK